IGVGDQGDDECGGAQSAASAPATRDGGESPSRRTGPTAPGWLCAQRQWADRQRPRSACATSHRPGVSALSSNAQYPPDLSLVPTPGSGTAREQTRARQYPAGVASADAAVYWFHSASSLLRWSLCLGAAPHSTGGGRGQSHQAHRSMATPGGLPRLSSCPSSRLYCV